MTTLDAVQSVFFAERKKEAARSTLRRLRVAGYLAVGELAARNQKYLRLTRLSARLLGAPASYCRWLGEQALLHRYALLCHCCFDDCERLLLTAHEFESEFVDCLGQHVAKEPYCLYEEDGESRLSYVMTDFGADPGRIVRKCNRAYAVRSQVPGFRTLLEASAFQVTVLTAEPTKQRAILSAAKRSSQNQQRIEVRVLPQLAEVM